VNFIENLQTVLGTPVNRKEIDFKIRTPNHSSIVNSPRNSAIKVMGEESESKRASL